jgi:hypothetical protein
MTRWAITDQSAMQQKARGGIASQALRKLSRTALIVSASVVGMPCGNPL